MAGRVRVVFRPREARRRAARPDARVTLDALALDSRPRKAVTLVETKHADPREFVLKTADRLRTQSELLAKLLGDLDERPQIVLVNAPEWLQVRTRLLEALRPHPEARQAVAAPNRGTCRTASSR